MHAFMPSRETVLSKLKKKKVGETAVGMWLYYMREFLKILAKKKVQFPVVKIHPVAKRDMSGVFVCLFNLWYTKDYKRILTFQPSSVCLAL